MGNQPSTEVKQDESDGAEEDLQESQQSPSTPSYPRAKEPSAVPCSPGIVYSSQVPASAIRPIPPFRPKPQLHELHESDLNVPSSPILPPLPPPTMSSATRDKKLEVPESPQYKQENSTPSNKSKKSKSRRSKKRSSISHPESSIKSSGSNHAQNGVSEINDINNVDDMNDNTSAIGDVDSHKGPKRRRRKAKKGLKKEQWPASPDLGNNEPSSDPAEQPRSVDIIKTHDTAQNPFLSLRPKSNTTVDSTPPNDSSKKRKATNSGSKSRKKSKRNSGGNMLINGTPFSSLAESLYAGRKNGDRIESSDNESANENAQATSPSYPQSRQDLVESIPNTNTDVADPNVVSDDEMEVDPIRDRSISHNEDQDEPDDASSNGGGSPLNKPRVEGGDSGDDRSGAFEGSEQENVGEENEDGSTSEAVQTHNETVNDKVELMDGAEGDDGSSFVSRPKSSTRKRFVKPTFYERLSEGDANGTIDHASSSPSSKSTKKKQPKISTMLRGNTEDSPAPKASTSKRRSVTKKVKKSQPTKFVKGQFSETEIRDITRAVERWRDHHNMTQFEVNALIQGNPQEVLSSDFWARVIATCPERARQKVINLCRRKFHNFVARGTWTPEQHEELTQLWEEHGNKYSLLGKLINRHPEDVRDRVRNYVVCGNSRRVDPWTLEEEERLQSIVTEALESIKEHRLNGHINSIEADEDLIDWQRVSERMDRTRSRLQCISKWKKISNRPSEAGIDGSGTLTVDQIIQQARDEVVDLSNHERYSIIKAIRASNVNAESRIPWAKVRTEHLDNKWTRPVIMLAWYRLKHLVPDWHIMSIPEIIMQLIRRYNETHALEFPSDDDYDLDAEFDEMVRKIKKILKVHRSQPKTPQTVIKTDDDEDEESQEEVESDQESEAAHAAEDDIEDDSQQDDESNGQSKDGDVSMRDEPVHGSDDNVDLGHNNEDDLPDFKPRKTPQSRKRFRSSSKHRAATPHKIKSQRTVVDESSEDEQVPDDEASSDTNASEVESIPAR
ncbi:uncharacterized protein F4822DRAFT_432477 [Hypoxylon trugodes]|uniref:uncharacterized protein n=1 Tax=Hypoxylon trugodes TaxID=326681 RepID=UPI002195AC5C|nr:uncharacterized protein F4822DRAFT_432477 [Hypoxylon trugodes]KAI1385622.1 hypothetical protein F4822DRAFT_432477 [Hypoxylon trugodes]